ncbi:MAG: molybdopterin-dependent oxidoreductase [Alphaproteobacteria bacterium]|nr:molybdopterin-dependent oxidoreductase [Alphaproteobacteria bacterium]
MMSDGGWTRTVCPYCGVGCGVLARPDAGGHVEIKGDPDHPANFGRLCSKGAALGETMSLDDRLLTPSIGGQSVSWETALDKVAMSFRSTIERHAPDSVALYVSGQILSEDYYVANKLMKGFIGTANIDTNSRLCMASSVAGHKRAFGSDTVPGTYQDLELADLVILVGSNLAWCHPVLYQRLVAARKARGTKVVVIDPRATATCEIADLHLPIAPGADVALFNGLLAYLASAGAVNQDYVERFTSGLGAALKSSADLSLEETASICGLRRADILAFYELFAATEKSVTVYSQGVNQSSAGTDKVNAIINCHLLTGRIGRPGMGPFSVTGQPNAMGGREVGGLANMLAAHMELGNAEHRRIVQEFWGAPRIAKAAGLKAVDLFDAVASGRIKALWIMATNPVDSLPEADRVRKAIQSCPFVVVSDVTRDTDTTALADVLLPAAAWGEKDGTVTNSERRISRQRAFIERPGEAKPDWWQICEVAKRLGYADAFAYESPHEIFIEYAALTGAGNDGSRDLDLSGLADITGEGYRKLEPIQWPAGHDSAPTDSRFFAEGGFYTSDRRARFVETPFRAPASSVSATYPLILNTGRIRDQWHTMTRTGKSARLMSHMSEPFLEIHPDDANTLGLAPASLCEVESRHGKALLRVSISPDQRRGSVFAPIHWTDQYTGQARIDALIASNTDPVSGQPESKFTPVAVRPFRASWYAFALCLHSPVVPPGASYYAKAPAKIGQRFELAGIETPADWDDFASMLLGVTRQRAEETLTYRDVRSGAFRFALLREGRLVGALFVGTAPLSVSRSWVADQLGQSIDSGDRLRLLAGRPGADVPDKGRIVCACYEVGAKEIAEAILKHGCETADAVGACVKAGTNCGSCRSEIAGMIELSRISQAS